MQLLFLPHLSGFKQEIVGFLLSRLINSAWFSNFSICTHLAGFTEKSRRKASKNLMEPGYTAQEMFSRSGYTAAEGLMCDSRARSCSGSSSCMFAYRCNATVRKQAFGREVTELEPERNKDCLWGFHLPV